MTDDDDTQVYRSELEAAVKAAIEAERSKLQAQGFEIYKMGYKQGASDERRACAKLCDGEGLYMTADAIRARGRSHDQ